MKKLFLVPVAAIFLFASCHSTTNQGTNGKPDSTAFVYAADRFADLQVLYYQVPGFDKLTLQQKKLAYYLYQAALSGRDIFYDQGYKNNILVRKTIEAIYDGYKGDTSSADWKKFTVYARRLWFSNGIHHHYSSNKFIPECSSEFFAGLVKGADATKLPLEGQTVDAFWNNLQPIIYDPTVAPKRTNLDPKADLMLTSADNFYEGVTQKEAADFYKNMAKGAGDTAISFGLNSKLVKENGKLIEHTWKVGGMYSAALSKVVEWLQKASTVAENPQQKKVIDLLVQFYQTGDLRKFDEYNIEWVKDTASTVDFTNGFIEVYHDPLGYKGSFEGIVSFKDLDATKRIKAISNQAQWFENQSPILPQHKKKDVKGITGKVITVVVECGDAGPSTPIGINLPNAEWIRQKYGSKSVNLGNVVNAYNESGKSSGMIDEFYANDSIIKRLKKYGSLANNLHTDMHECIGHASGQINAGVATFNETLKNYSNTLEEARADLVALYYITDPKLVEIGVEPTTDVGKAEYDNYINNGLMVQLTRLPENENQLEEAHMRNRQMIAGWVYDKGQADKVISKITQNGKTYFIINDYAKLRVLFGQLLREVQRIKSEGDYAAGSALVENYGVKVDPTLHKEVLERFKKLNVAPYKGFIQPTLTPVMSGNDITDVKVDYPKSFTEQMLNYGKLYGLLGVKN